MRAWALLVVSSEGQRENLSDYLELAQADAKRQGWTLERLGDFSAVASGKSGVRAPMLALVAAAAALSQERRPAWVWMRRVDRVGRGRATESMLALYSLYDLGIRIWDHDTGEVRLDTAEGELPAMLKTWFGRLENEIRSGKAREKYAQKRAAGLTVGNHRPYGLALEAGRDVAVADRAAIVRQVFSLRLEGLGYRSIANRVASIAPNPTSTRTGEERSLTWSPQAIRRMLTNRAYVGPIVDEFTFRRAQQMTPAGDDRTRKHPWPLAGAIRCTCGRMLIGEPSRPRGMTVFRYYACRGRHVGVRPRHPAKVIEEQFVALIRALDESPELIAQYRASSIDPAQLRQALRSANAALTEIDRRRALVWSMLEDGHVRREDVQERLDALAGERADALERVGDIDGQLLTAEAAQRGTSDLLTIIREAVADYEEADPDDQRRIARIIAAALGGLIVTLDHQLVTVQMLAARSV